MSWGGCVSLSRLRMKGKGGLLEEGRGGGGGGGHFEGGLKSKTRLESMVADEERLLRSFVYSKRQNVEQADGFVDCFVTSATSTTVSNARRRRWLGADVTMQITCRGNHQPLSIGTIVVSKAKWPNSSKPLSLCLECVSRAEARN